MRFSYRAERNLRWPNRGRWPWMVLEIESGLDWPFAFVKTKRMAKRLARQMNRKGWLTLDI